jgi:nicotinate-nucleotide pyrophosphorylase (carboxylating)
MHDLPHAPIERLIDAALAEDLALGDVTSRLTVAAGREGTAEAVAKSPLVLAGLEIFAAVFRRVDPDLRVRLDRADGDRLVPADVPARIEGNLRSILAAERTALNLLQRLCGIATLTRRCVDAVLAGARARITDTRKTTPGLRLLERYAVRCGGGINHRSDLSGGILVKDNHVAACGSVGEAVRRALAGAGPTARVEVEVTDPAQVEEALAAGAAAILLDNMDPKATAEAVRRVAGRAVIEASGGIGPADVAAVAAAGVDFISIGALTHSAPAADISLEVRP